MARFIITSIFIPVIVVLTLLFRELINLDSTQTIIKDKLTRTPVIKAIYEK